MTDREDPSAGFWITVALLVVLVGYPLSFGPACWISSRTNSGARSVQLIYGPICTALSHVPILFSSAVRQYVNVLAANNWSLGIGGDDQWTWDQDVPFAGVTETILH